ALRADHVGVGQQQRLARMPSAEEGARVEQPSRAHRLAAERLDPGNRSTPIEAGAVPLERLEAVLPEDLLERGVGPDGVDVSQIRSRRLVAQAEATALATQQPRPPQ